MYLLNMFQTSEHEYKEADIGAHITKMSFMLPCCHNKGANLLQIHFGMAYGRNIANQVWLIKFYEAESPTKSKPIK